MAAASDKYRRAVWPASSTASTRPPSVEGYCINIPLIDRAGHTTSARFYGAGATKYSVHGADTDEKIPAVRIGKRAHIFKKIADLVSSMKTRSCSQGFQIR